MSACLGLQVESLYLLQTLGVGRSWGAEPCEVGTLTVHMPRRSKPGAQILLRE